MSKFLFALALLSSSAFAGFDDPSDVGAPQVRYLSWCQKNLVMEEGARGRPVVKADCEAEGAFCREFERIIGGGRIVYATCANRR